MKPRKFLIIALGLAALDQLSKFLLYGKSYVINGIGISPASNTGAAFGILQNNNLVLALFSMVVIGFIIYYHKKLKGIQQIGILLILAGALGNLLDRFLFGFVRDFISFYSWPIFNFADSYNVIGVFLIIISELRRKK